MRKIMCIMFCTILTSVAWSQGLYVASGGEVTIKPTAFVFVTENVEVDAAGSLTAESDATNSSSFLAPAGTITGNVTYKRYVVGANDANVVGVNWHLVSAPTGTQDIATFASASANSVSTNASGQYAVATYDNTLSRGSRWVYYTDATTANFVRGKGYSMHRSASGVYTFTGMMNDGDVTLPMVTSSGTHYEFCLGNPYPSFLSASAIYTDNMDALNQTVANAIYCIWNGSGYTRVINNTTPQHEYLPPGQAFMVVAKDDNQDFTFNEASQTYQRGASDNFERTTAVPSVIVNLSNASGNVSTELKYYSNTTSGLDIGWDAGTLREGTPSFSIDTHLVSDSEGIDFMLQCLPDSDYESNIVPLSVRASAGEEITFDAVASNLPSDMNVYLEDKINNTIEKINDDSYTVTLTDAISGIGNFYLHTSRTALSIDDTNVLNTVNLYKTSNSNLRITGLQEEGKASVKMYSLTGQEVLEHSFTMQRVNDVALPSLKTGMYLVQVVSEDGKYTKKLIIE